MMKLSIFLFSSLLISSCYSGNTQEQQSANPDKNANEKIISTSINYKDGDVNLKGFAASANSNGRKPAVIIIHEWWGNNEYSKSRARQIADLGYVAFALDMYGNGDTANNPEDAQKLAGAFYTDISLAKRRFEAALKTVKMMPNVDTTRIAIIGYCFGGSQALNMARIGEPVKAVVSFHGGLDLTPVTVTNPTTKILVCNGAADAFVTKESIDNFMKDMKGAGFSVDFKNYPDAHHAFTNPNADSHHMDNVGYNAAADTASWNDMKAFLAKEL